MSPDSSTTSRPRSLEPSPPQPITHKNVHVYTNNYTYGVKLDPLNVSLSLIFLRSTIVSIPKDNKAFLSNFDIYRGISLFDCLLTPLTIVCEGPIIPLLVHQPAYPSIWPAAPSFQCGAYVGAVEEMVWVGVTEGA